MPKIVVLSVSAGAGHVRCAESIVAAAQARGWQARHIDAMDYVPALFRTVYIQSYLRMMARAPALWSYVYHATNHPATGSLQRFRKLIENLNTRRLEAVIAAEGADYVVCTHFLPAQVASRMTVRKRLTVPVWVVVTDFDLHALWVQPHLHGYCAAAEEVAWRMRDARLGAKVVVTGIPIMPNFAACPPRAECARELGLDPARKTVLLASGGFGVGALDTAAGALLEGVPDACLVALAGRNAELYAKLAELAKRWPGRLLPLRFTEHPENVVACADLMVSKPGGLTTSECLAMGLPMIVVAPLPGQEEHNADFLLEQGVAMRAYDNTGLVARVAQLLGDPDRLAAMSAKARTLGRPRAADAVLDAVIAG
jgi:processive 1,2-diacylglycerol beta-glucosyltransferase